jgi:hypothetical protein
VVLIRTLNSQTKFSKQKSTYITIGDNWFENQINSSHPSENQVIGNQLFCFKYFFENQVHYTREEESGSQVSKIKLPISRHVPIIQHFSIFFKLSKFWMHKLEGYECSLSVKNKEATPKKRRG